jgi:hypothetical protein
LPAIQPDSWPSWQEHPRGWQYQPVDQDHSEESGRRSNVVTIPPELVSTKDH